jgi:uncharacterized membrane protein YidH (DUF202 family)
VSDEPKSTSAAGTGAKEAAPAAPDPSAGAAPLPPPPPAPVFPSPPPPSGTEPGKPFIRTFRSWLHDYFLGEAPTFSTALVPLCFLSMALFTRHPLKTNFIFDEQEALLANPYVRSVVDPKSKLRWIDAFHRDFWGLPPDRSIGSYRPLPDLVWRFLWMIGARDQSPFLHHWVNVLLHGVNGALMVIFVLRVTKDRKAAWLAGAALTACAVLTEAVSGVVGIADVLGTLGALLALLSITLSFPWMPLALLGSTLLGLYSKESALCIVPLVPLAALLLSARLFPERPLRWGRTAVALAATGAAFVFYVEMRRRWFPTTTPPELTVEANAGKPLAVRAFKGLLRWYAQPGLPHDPLNNPLVAADGPHRVAGGLRVYWRGLTQIVFPHPLSGDYSAPQEPVPDRLVFPESVLGGLAMVVPPLACLVLGVRDWLRDSTARRRQMPLPKDAAPLVALALAWVVGSYFPVSNVPIVLPTVRAERFWYFPAIGTAILLGVAFARLLERAQGKLRHVAIGAVVLFFLVQGVAARAHANDYTDDLTFWDATRKAVPRSAKAHLNYSVMKGARGDLPARLASNQVALELAPEWPMASVYLADTLCRMHRAPEAWPHYLRGFELAPNDVNLIALGIQCLWDEGQLGLDNPIRAELQQAGARHPGSWLDYLQRDTLENGETHKGVDPKYRPRGYNEGPKGE